MNAVTNMRKKKPFLWINPNKLSLEKALSQQKLSLSDIQEASRRLKRFAPLLVKIFPELNSSSGIIDSNCIFR